MPTGYTADIAKGITFQQFALNCARAFGALIMMRDGPFDAPIPEKFEPSDYHIKALERSRTELARLDAMSTDDANAAAVEEYIAAVESREKRIAEKTELRNKYNAMLAQVVKWEPPTQDHVKYKEFMLDQIQQSISWDCDTSYDSPPARLNGSQWLAQRIQRERDNIAYHEKENAEEIARNNGRNEWVKALRDSL